MKTRNLKSLMLVALMLVAPAVNAQKFSRGGITYVIENGEAYVTGGFVDWEYLQNKYVGNVVVPANVFYRGNNYDVVGLKDAFVWQNRLTSITLGKNIRKLGDRTTDPGTGMGDEDIMEFDCPKLRSINVSPQNKHFSSVNGVLFNKDKTILHCYPQNKVGKTYIIPSTVQEIGEGAFCSCKRLKYLTIPDNVMVLGEQSFIYAGIDRLNIGKGVTKIHNDAICEAFIGEITVDPDNKNYSSLDGCLLSKDKSKLLYYPIVEGLTVMRIPDGVKIVSSGVGANVQWESCKKIIYPESVSEVYGCHVFLFPVAYYIRRGEKATTGVHVYCYNKIPPKTGLEEYSDEYPDSNIIDAILHVPAGCIDAYKRSPWGKFCEIVEIK